MGSRIEISLKRNYEHAWKYPADSFFNIQIYFFVHLHEENFRFFFFFGTHIKRLSMQMMLKVSFYLLFELDFDLR